MIIPTPLADMYIDMVLKCNNYYKMEFSDGCFSYEESLQCYERGGHTDAHKTRLASFSEDGGIICWNNLNEDRWFQQRSRRIQKNDDNLSKL